MLITAAAAAASWFTISKEMPWRGKAILALKAIIFWEIPRLSSGMCMNIWLVLQRVAFWIVVVGAPLKEPCVHHSADRFPSRWSQREIKGWSTEWEVLFVDEKLYVRAGKPKRQRQRKERVRFWWSWITIQQTCWQTFNLLLEFIGVCENFMARGLRENLGPVFSLVICFSLQSIETMFRFIFQVCVRSSVFHFIMIHLYHI